MSRVTTRQLGIRGFSRRLTSSANSGFKGEKLRSLGFKYSGFRVTEPPKPGRKFRVEG